jgi:hypothetical protein
MSKSTKVAVAAAGALLVAGTLAAAPAPATAAPTASSIQDIYQGAGLHQDKHILNAAAKKKAGKKNPGGTKPKAPKPK